MTHALVPRCADVRRRKTPQSTASASAVKGPPRWRSGRPAAGRSCRLPRADAVPLATMSIGRPRGADNQAGKRPQGSDAMVRATYMALLVLSSMHSAAAADAPRYVASRDLILSYRTANDAAAAQVEVWVSTDAGRTWRLTPIVPAGNSSVRYTAPDDGRYDFYVVLKHGGAASAPEPTPGVVPTASVCVDTTPPLVQVHGAAAPLDADEGRTVTLDITVIEEHLSDAALRVFYRGASGAWTDGGPAQLSGNRLTWRAPPAVPARAALRVVVTDLAGNRTFADLSDVSIEPAAPDTGPAPEPDGANGATDPVTTQPSADPHSPPVVVDPRVAELRQRAEEFLQRGAYSLAEARFTDALRHAPQDAALLIGAGNALYRLGRYDDAAARFQAALEASPDRAEALDGLALVAATQRRYPQALEYLRQLRRVRPDSGTAWLRSGDLAHRLGNVREAREAWRRVLELPAVDDELREKARRRLEYFGLERATQEGASTQSCLVPARQNRPSSSSTATTPIEKTAR